MSPLITHHYCVDCDAFHPMNGCATYQSVKAGIADAKAGRISDAVFPVTDTPTPERGEPDRFEITPDFLPKRPQDFPEDFSHENGNYRCRCYRCGHYFVGHKRRVTCKLCVTIDALRAECARKDAEIARLTSDRKGLRSALRDVYERMDCSDCRTSPDFLYCDDCEAIREQAMAALEITTINPGAPRDGE